MGHQMGYQTDQQVDYLHEKKSSREKNVSNRFDKPRIHVSKQFQLVNEPRFHDLPINIVLL